MSATSKPQGVLIGGDIAESHDLVDHLQQIDDELQLPVYFVLGNHDLLRLDCRDPVRGHAARPAAPRLHYLK